MIIDRPGAERAQPPPAGRARRRRLSHAALVGAGRHDQRGRGARRSRGPLPGRPPPRRQLHRVRGRDRAAPRGRRPRPLPRHRARSPTPGIAPDARDRGVRAAARPRPPEGRARDGSDASARPVSSASGRPIEAGVFCPLGEGVVDCRGRARPRSTPSATRASRRSSRTACRAAARLSTSCDGASPCSNAARRDRGLMPVRDRHRGELGHRPRLRAAAGGGRLRRGTDLPRNARSRREQTAAAARARGADVALVRVDFLDDPEAARARTPVAARPAWEPRPLLSTTPASARALRSSAETVPELERTLRTNLFGPWAWLRRRPKRHDRGRPGRADHQRDVGAGAPSARRWRGVLRCQGRPRGADQGAGARAR